MASVSTSHLILFIASMMIAASVAGVFIDGVTRVSSALSDQSIDMSSDIRTDIEIISDPDAGNVYNDTDASITLLVKNTGSQRLPADPEALDVLVDGTYQTNVSLDVVTGPSWAVGDVVRLEIHLSEGLAAGDHRVLVIANGNREVFEFRT